jgi:hypothetical protein
VYNQQQGKDLGHGVERHGVDGHGVGRNRQIEEK